MDSLADIQTFCTNWLNTWSGNKPDELIRYYTKDALYIDPANPGGLKGEEEMLTYFKKLLSRNPDWQWFPVEIFKTSSGFTLKWKANIPVNGSNLIIYGLDIVELRNGLICRNEVYFDRTPWLQLLK
jgi:hypothetical protein